MNDESNRNAWPPQHWERLSLSAVLIFLFCLLLAVNALGTEPVKLRCQTISLPSAAGDPLFVDVEGHGHCNLLVLDTAEKKLLNYRQRPDGFTNTPDQVMALPAQTAWVAPCDVDAHPGLELLMSTPTGLFYSLQHEGLFEPEQHYLIAGPQTCTNTGEPLLTLLSTNQAGTNDLIPVISAPRSLLYRRNDAYEWSSGPTLAPDPGQAAWSTSQDNWFGRWTLGPHPGRSLDVDQTFRTLEKHEPEPAPENDTIRKIMANLKTNSMASAPEEERMDVNGDGREDLVLWQVSGMVDCRTELYIFLRDANQQLPTRPTQILHCRGFPIPIGSTRTWSPLHELSGDGICELVLLEMKTSLASPSRLVEMLLSRGIDWSLTIRTFRQGAFSRSPDASLPVTGILPSEILGDWPFLIQGDFNGDGRLDLLVRRSETEWNVFLSSSDGRWFAPQPAFTFNVPPHGYMEIKDLNGDGPSDIIWHEWDQPRLSLFMPPREQLKSKSP
ncbi:MAG: VCBS repeat-containing protein [Verrucomicrobiota bacterium]|jgi:hypothetical protein